MNGSREEVNQRMREGYYKTSNLIFLVYKIEAPETMYNAKKVWLKEIKDAVDTVKDHDIQLVLTGSSHGDNQEENVGTVSQLTDEDLELMLNDKGGDDSDDRFGKFRRSTRGKSVRKEDAQKVAEDLSLKLQRRRSISRQCKNNKASVNGLFHDVVLQYVFKQGK